MPLGLSKKILVCKRGFLLGKKAQIGLSHRLGISLVKILFFVGQQFMKSFARKHQARLFWFLSNSDGLKLALYFFLKFLANFSKNYKVCLGFLRLPF